MMNKNLLTTLIFSLIIVAAFFTATEFTKADVEEINSTNLSWENSEQLTNGTTETNGGLSPSIALSANGKNIIVAYMQKNGPDDGDADPYFSQSNDYGENWSSPSSIHTSGTDSYDPNVAIDQNIRGHAVWIEASRELWYNKQQSGGGWGSATKLYEPTAAGQGELAEPVIIASKNNKLDIVWAHRDDNGSAFNIYHARSTNGNATNPTWTPANNTLVYASPIGGNSEQVDATVDDSGTLHVVWKEQTLAGSEIFYGQFNGTDWLPQSGANFAPINISADNVSVGSKVFNQPSIHMQGSNILVAFENREGQDNQNAYFVTCNVNCTNANNWSGQKISTKNYSVKNTDPAFLNPQIVVSGSCPVVFFSSMDLTPVNDNDDDDNEHIRTSSGCEGWSKNNTVPSVEATLGTNRRAIAPDAATANGWYIYLAYERRENLTTNIFVTRNIPGLYLPVVLK